MLLAAAAMSAWVAETFAVGATAVATGAAVAGEAIATGAAVAGEAIAAGAAVTGEVLSAGAAAVGDALVGAEAAAPTYLALAEEGAVVTEEASTLATASGAIGTAATVAGASMVLTGAAVTGGMELKQNKTGQYTNDYQKDIDDNNQEAVASAVAYIYSKGGKEKADAYVSQFLPGYSVDARLSSNDHVVLRNDAEKKAIVAYRGTDVGNVSDLAADYHIATKGDDFSESIRFHKAMTDYRNARESLPGYDFTVTGHSLGGAQAMWVARQDPSVNAVVFNPGVVGLTGSQQLAKGAHYAMSGGAPGRGSQYDNIKLIRNDGDIVSAGYYSVTGEGTKDADGKEIVNKELGRAWRPGMDHGVRLTNAKFQSDKSGIGWTLAAHSLDSFLTNEQASIFNSEGGVGKGEVIDRVAEYEKHKNDRLLPIQQRVIDDKGPSDGVGSGSDVYTKYGLMLPQKRKDISDGGETTQAPRQDVTHSSYTETTVHRQPPAWHSSVGHYMN